MIVKNEAQWLQKSLPAARPYVDEMVVVDTGSTDDTAEVARTLGARVDRFPWQEHFGDARNRSLELASGDWVLVLDADEVLRGPFPDILRKLADAGMDAYMIDLLNYLTHPESPPEERIPVLRFFRKTPGLHYVGRVHEQIFVQPERILRAPPELEIHHYGYLPEEVRGKSKEHRNLQLLQKAADEEKDPRLLRFQHFNLAREYQRLGRLEEAIATYTEVLDDPEIWNEVYGPVALAFRLECLLAQDRLEEALAETGAVLARFSGYTEVQRWRAGILARQGKIPEAEAAYWTALGDPRLRPWLVKADPRVHALCWFELGQLYASQGHILTAAQCLSRALLEESPPPDTLPRLLQVFSLFPEEHLRAWLPLFLRRQPSLRPLLEPARPEFPLLDALLEAITA